LPQWTGIGESPFTVADPGLEHQGEALNLNKESRKQKKAKSQGVAKPIWSVQIKVHSGMQTSFIPLCHQPTMSAFPQYYEPISSQRSLQTLTLQLEAALKKIRELEETSTLS
jgi:hypothetical protein